MAQISREQSAQKTCTFLVSQGCGHGWLVLQRNPYDRRKLMNIKNPIFLTAGAFLSAWAASNFDIDYRAILWAVLAGVFGYATPKK
jgi:hypothetical protein